jgi:hypothetical protein
MKTKFIFLLSFILFSLGLMAQKEGVQVRLSISETFYIDSIQIKDPPLHLNRLNTLEFQIDHLLTPESALQSFISFTNKKWGRAIVTEDYNEMFPGERILQIHNSEDHIKNAYLKIFSVIYLKSNNKRYAACLYETYINDEYPNYKDIIVYEYLDNKWLLVNTWHLSRIKKLNVLKNEYIIKLLKGTRLKGNAKYNELFEKVYKVGTLDLEVFNTVVKLNEIYYSSILK